MTNAESYFCGLPRLKFELSITSIKLKKKKINFKDRAMGIVQLPSLTLCQPMDCSTPVFPVPH